MSRVGIVGSEAVKFTEETERKARAIIDDLIVQLQPDTIVSGECHLGGIDTWAKEAAAAWKTKFIGHAPKVLNWSQGYKPRNILIAEDSDRVYCITVRKLPDNYKGMTFKLCYHCGTSDHIKSGGCWTVKYARKIGKQGEIIVV